MPTLMDDIRKISGLPDSINKIKVPDVGVMVLQPDKVILKDAGSKKHLTAWYRKDGTIDVHITIEGKTRFHSQHGTLDMRMFDEKVVERLILDCMRQINLDDHELQTLNIQVPKERIDFGGKLYKMKGKVAIVSAEGADEFERNMERMTFAEFDQSDCTEALVFHGEDFVGRLYWRPDGYFYFDQAKFNRLFSAIARGKAVVSFSDELR